MSKQSYLCLVYHLFADLKNTPSKHSDTADRLSVVAKIKSQFIVFLFTVSLCIFENSYLFCDDGDDYYIRYKTHCFCNDSVKFLSSLKFNVQTNPLILSLLFSDKIFWYLSLPWSREVCFPTHFLIIYMLVPLPNQHTRPMILFMWPHVSFYRS